MAFIPPPVEPAHPPINDSISNKKGRKLGQDAKSCVANPEPEVVAEQPNQEVEAPYFSLADVSEELAEVELYYASEVNAKIEAVKEYDESEEFLEDIEFLRTEFEALR